MLTTFNSEIQSTNHISDYTWAFLRAVISADARRILFSLLFISMTIVLYNLGNIIFVTMFAFCLLSVLVNRRGSDVSPLLRDDSYICFLIGSGPVQKTVWFWSAVVCTICSEGFCFCCRTSCWRRWWTNWSSRRLCSSWSTTLLLSYSRASWRSAHV